MCFVLIVHNHPWTERQKEQLQNFTTKTEIITSSVRDSPKEYIYFECNFIQHVNLLGQWRLWLIFRIQVNRTWCWLSRYLWLLQPHTRITSQNPLALHHWKTTIPSMQLGRRRSNLLGRCPPAPHHRCLTSLPRGSVGGEMAAALSRALKLPGKMRYTYFSRR